MPGNPKRKGRGPIYYRKGKLVRDSESADRTIHTRIRFLEERYVKQIDELSGRLESLKKTIGLLNQRGPSVVSLLRRDVELEIGRLEEMISSIEGKRLVLSRKKAEIRKH